jgi:isoleucyl-tRNA synthetase
MSKSKGNLVVPWDAIAEHGADAIRWYFITSSNPWVPKRYDAEGVKEAARKFFDTLLSTYHFFRMYAQVEEWSPSDADPAAADRPLLDRWLLSRLDSVVRGVRRELDGYQITKAYRLLGDFVVEDLSNWYVRRSRSRFWGNSDAEDMRAAFRTLWDALRQVSLLAAPVVPFMADWLHRALTGSSAHLERYPQPSDLLDEELEADMVAARTLVSLGRAAREEVKIRVRQPLRRAEAVLPRSRTLSGQVLELVREELNVKQVDFLSDAEELVTLVPRPNYRALGPRFGKKTNEAANVLRALSQEALNAYRDGQPVEFEVDGEHYTLEPGDLEIVQEARGELIVKGEGATTIALDGTLDDELIAEGVARELVNRIQRLRRDVGLEITDRIDLMIAGPELVRDAATTHREFIGGETLAPTMAVEEHVTEGTFEHVREVDLDGTPATIALQSVSA